MTNQKFMKNNSIQMNSENRIKDIEINHSNKIHNTQDEDREYSEINNELKYYLNGADKSDEKVL